jgi:hypothetical protein
MYYCVCAYLCVSVFLLTFLCVIERVCVLSLQPPDRDGGTLWRTGAAGDPRRPELTVRNTHIYFQSLTVTHSISSTFSPHTLKTVCVCVQTVSIIHSQDPGPAH